MISFFSFRTTNQCWNSIGWLIQEQRAVWGLRNRPLPNSHNNEDMTSMGLYLPGDDVSKLTCGIKRGLVVLCTVSWNYMESTRPFHKRKPLTHELMRERMSAVKSSSETSSAEQANEWAVRADEQMAQYSSRRFHSHSTHSALLPWGFLLWHGFV